MKKFTKTVTKAVLTLAAVLAFNAYAGDTATPVSALHHYDSGNWPGVYEYSSDTMVYNTKTAVWLDNVLGLLTNKGHLQSTEEYGLYSKSVNNSVVIENHDNGNISGKWAGVNMTGTNGNLNNYGVISSSDYGVIVDPETGTSNIIDFWIKNGGTITSTNIAILQMNDKKKMNINNTWSGNITGNYYGILANGNTDIINDGLIQARDSSAIFMAHGGTVTNNGIIRTESLAAYAKAIHHLGLGGNQLTLKGSGRYEGNITFGGDPNLAMVNGILSIESDGIDFRNSRLENWGVINIDGGNHYFNVENEAKNANEPFTHVFAKNNVYIHTGAGSWGDANFYLTNNSLLNPFKNRHDTDTPSYWDRLAYSTAGDTTYNKKEYEKLTIRDLSLKSGSALVMDVRYSEPDYKPQNAIFSEDDRIGYWGDLNLAEGEFNPDGSYAGFGISSRILKTWGGDPFDLYTYQRVSYDKIDVAGTVDLDAGTKLYLLDHSKWLGEDGKLPSFVEEDFTLNEIVVDLFDGNIHLNDFDIDFYSDYYGIDHIDNDTGKVYLSRDAYGSDVKCQIDWWLKQASLGFAELNPLTASSLSPEDLAAARADTDAAIAQLGVALKYSSDESTGSIGSGSVVVTDDGNVGTQIVAKYIYSYDDEGEINKKSLNPNYVENPTITSNDDDDDYEDHSSRNVIHPIKTPVKSELLPYQISQEYSSKITDLDTTVQLRDTIRSFQSWDDVDAFMDMLNKLEYASLATSNLNLISNRVNQMFDRLSAGHMRDNNGLNIWGDIYSSDDSLDGTGNHGIDGHGIEFAAGVDKMFNNTTFGLSATYTDYTSTVNDDDVHTDIESIGFGLNLYMMMDQGNLRHKAMLGYASYHNTGDDVQAFDSSEMFASYRAEWTIKTDSLEIKPFAGIRYSMVQFDEMREDAENGLKAFDQDSLETELGVKLVKQFNKLGINVSGAWMHEMLDSQTTAEAFTSFGNFSQKGIARDSDSFRATIGFEYKLSEKVTLDFDYAKEMSANSESDSLNGKITFRF